MSFSESSACNFVPLLARIVLGIAFISAGFSKIFKDAEFNQADVDALQTASAGDLAEPAWTIEHASFTLLQEAPPTPPAPAGGRTGQDAGDEVEETLDDLEQEAEDAGDALQGRRRGTRRRSSGQPRGRSRRSHHARRKGREEESLRRGDHAQQVRVRRLPHQAPSGSPGPPP